ncbi:hypothetical protein FKM82_007117 [Ascaphus truei]
MDASEDQIAIVGIGCNFPGGEGIDNFWKVIVEGRNCTVEIPAERFDTKHWCDPDYNKPGKICTSRAALIEGFNEFDNRLFGIHNSETASMDPQQKLLLECTYRALEDAGIPAENISGSKTGVFIGLMNTDCNSIYNNSEDSINHFNGTGTSMSIAANRISYCFNLTGPSLAMDTACSSSLVALHYACQAIKQGDCEMAVCGGVSCIIEPRVFVALSKANMISPEGTSKPFSKKADGYGRGEGCGMVLLKPLKKAKEDFSKVWGVICVSAVNQDGRSVTPITKPSQIQQENLLQSVYKTIDPSAVQYVEAHGTGTPVGDLVEAASIGNIIGKKRSSGSLPLKIGSVKGNIGHTESAAGMAGLIKVILMMHNEVIPPSLHYSKELSSIKTEESNIMIPTGNEKWEDPGKLGRTAGVNSFGFGGTNVHVVIRQHKQKDSPCYSKRPIEIFILSAASSKSLALTIEDTKQEISKMKSLSLQSLAYTSACRRSHVNYKYRAAFVTTSLPHLQQQLASANTDISPAKVIPQIVFVFCGNGVNYKGMCKMLLRSEPVFRKKCNEIDEILQAYTPLSVIDLLEKEFDDFSRPDIAQPLLFTIQVSLVALLRYWGVKPDSIVGHSVGEVAAAHCAGLLSLQDAVKVIYYRSTLQSKVTGGKMLVISNVPVTDISNVIESYSGRICIAAYNSPTSCTLSGDAHSIQRLSSQLTQQYSEGEISLHPLDVPAAYHSHLMDPILEEIKANLHDLKKQKLETDLISTVTGKTASEGDFTTGKYWARNIREPVAFEQALKTSTNGKENLVFVEIGPRRALQRNIVEVFGQNTVILPAVQPSKEYETIFTILQKLFTDGHNPDWGNIYEMYTSVPAVIPRYQFDHIKQDIKFETTRQGNKTVATSNHPLLHGMSKNLTEFSCTISQEVTPYVYEHKNNGTIIVPGSFFVELGLASTINSLKPKVPLNSLEISIQFSKPYVVNQQSHNLQIKLEQGNKVTKFEILTSHVYALGQIQKKNGVLNEEKISLQHISKRCTNVHKGDQIYDRLSKFGFQYGNVYKQLSEVHCGEDLNEAISVIKVSEEIKETMYEYCIHPVILDCFLQMSAFVCASPTESAALFPSSIGSLTVFRPLQEEMFIYVKTIETTENYFDVCGYFADGNGFILAEVKNARITSVRQAMQKSDNFLFQNTWIEAPGSEKINRSKQEPQILVFADISGIGLGLEKYIHHGLTYIMYNNSHSEMDLQKIHNSECKDILFMWGIHRVREDFPKNVTQYLAKFCEAYRQVILAVRQSNSKACIRTVTYRTTEKTVDHINPGFALVGMTRACVMEMTEITFQLIDISSSNTENIEALAQVVLNYKPNEHPEIWINEGKIYTSEITRTTINVTDNRQHTVLLKKSDSFTLHSADAYRVTELSAKQTDPRITELPINNVEVQIDQICIHTEDYFPVSASSCQFGKTLYWNTLAMDKHKLIALDFTGTVTAIGKGVRKLKLGDHVASCYPTVASSRVALPETVCYLVKKVPPLKNLPCVSPFILAWEILHHQLPKATNKPKLTIITSEAKSVLCKVLTVTAKKSGWELTASSDKRINAEQCSAMIILPPLGDISREDLSHLPLLKDLVIICDRKNPDSYQNLTESYKEDVHIHLLNLANIFQKAYINQFAKDIYKWLKSMHADMIISLPNSSSVQSICTNNCTNATVSSYFTAQSLPLLQLDKNTISSISLSVGEQMFFKHDAAYIVTGGLTGLGFETVKFIAQHGGGHIVILSRRNPTTEMQHQIKKVQNETMCKIITLQCNVTNDTEVMKAIDSVLLISPNIQIKGVFHSAVVFHDGVLQNLNMSHFEKVLSPKVEGALNLHHATIKQELDYFVCYSSIASFIGNTGQANYAAANSFLDKFCQYRRNKGLSGQSINWGALNLGVLLNQYNIHRLLQAKGILLLETREIHKCLEKILMLNNSHQAIVKFNFKALHDNLVSLIPTLNKRLYNVFFEEMFKLQDTAMSNVSQKPSNIKQEDYIISLVSELASVSLSDITMSTALNSLGIDSMLAMTLQNRLFQEKNVNLPLVKLLDPSTTVSFLVSMFKENTADTAENIEDSILEETRL